MSLLGVVGCRDHSAFLLSLLTLSYSLHSSSEAVTLPVQSERQPSKLSASEPGCKRVILLLLC